MKRIILLLAIILVQLMCLGAEPDSTQTVKRSDVYQSLQRKYDEAEQKFQSSLTKEQRQMQDAMKSIITQAQTLQAVKTVTDSTFTFHK